MLLATALAASACGSPRDGPRPRVPPVETFDECIDAGGRIALKEPPVCYLGGRSFQDPRGSLSEPRRRPVPSADRYALDPDPGHCEAAITRYYYDRDETRCAEFLWGGCGGVVPFETLDECEAGLPLLDR